MAYLIEAIVVGIMTVITGLIVQKLVSYTQLNNNLNVQSVYIIHLFIIGFLIHVMSEWVGINQWYCRNGNACIKLI